MKKQKSENQSAAYRVLRNIVGRTMAFALAMTLGGALTNIRAADADALPGLGVQPVEYFYTGKPYDADSESYTFKYRNYDPEINRWTSTDPSGFPDGANHIKYVDNPVSKLDALGLTTVDNISQALTFWGRSGGSASDVATAGSTVINNIKNSSGFSELIFNIQTQRIQPQLRNVNPGANTGYLADNTGLGPASIGFVDLVVGRTSISYSDTSSWNDLSGWIQNDDGDWGRWLLADTDLSGSVSDLFDFVEHSGDPFWLNLLEETLPGWYSGDGVPFVIDGSFSYNFETFAWQYE